MATSEGSVAWCYRTGHHGYAVEWQSIVEPLADGGWGLREGMRVIDADGSEGAWSHFPLDREPMSREYRVLQAERFYWSRTMAAGESNGGY